nr:hypothetical protein [Nesterenkonia alkaliphila]
MVGELIAVSVTCIYAFIITWVLAKVMDLIMGIRVTDEVEEDLDFSIHGETAYDYR